MRLLPILLLSLAAATPLAAQFDSTTIAGRVIQRRIAALEQDTLLKQLAETGQLDFASGFSAATLNRLDDQTVLLFARLMARGMERASADECAQLLSAASGDQSFWLMVGRVQDSLEAEDWATLLTRVIWSEVEQRPMGRVATGEESQQILVSLIRHAPVKEQQMFVKAAGRPDAGCLVTPWMLDRLVVKNPEHSAALIRGLMASGSSPD